jgi:hypothetical protein
MMKLYYLKPNIQVEGKKFTSGSLMDLHKPMLLTLLDAKAEVIYLLRGIYVSVLLR